MRVFYQIIIICTMAISSVLTATAEVVPPNYYAIVVGVSQYEGKNLNLRFAAKDAGCIANSLRLGANRLFGTEKVQVTLLSTEKGDGVIAPTKKNIKQAFDAVANTAKTDDVLVVYFAGHGITLPLGQDMYCFLTSEARSANDIIDPGLRNITAITSEELHAWLGKIAARKQVIILDTCAAGAASDNLMEKRDITGDQQRAITRLREREGVHILMGCTADAKSYETSQYSQGLLTYALLEGMKGAALQRENYLDITTLFSYVADTVPILAKNIGGIQRPVSATPRGESFDIGELTVADRQQIPLSTLKPIILRPVLMNPEVVGDPLHLSRAVQDCLRERTLQDSTQAAPFLFLDTASFPGAITPRGLYTVNGETVKVTMKLWCDGKELGTVTATSEAKQPETLANSLVTEIPKALAKK